VRRGSDQAKDIREQFAKYLFTTNLSWASIKKGVQKSDIIGRIRTIITGENMYQIVFQCHVVDPLDPSSGSQSLLEQLLCED
jgi:hypothetical protein